MDLTEESDIEITTFINPHLFWIIVKNDERSKLLEFLTKELHETCIDKNHLNVSNNIFELGEIVAALINNKLYRATVEDIDTENKKSSYLLWLIDFGTLRESTVVYKLPASLRKTPPLSLQASLNNVVYIEQILEYDDFGRISSVNKHTINPTLLSRQVCISHIEKAHDIKFKCEENEDGIVFGDILYKDEDNSQISLRNILKTEGVLDTDESLSNGISDFINNYKENHLMVIAKICHKEPYSLEGEKENTNDLRKTCMNIASKALDEFEYNDILSFEDKYAEPLWQSRKSKRDTITSLDITVSDTETPTKTKSKKEKLLEKLWQHKNSQKANGIHDNSASELTDDSFNKTLSPKPIVTPKSKIKILIDKLKQHKNAKEKPVIDSVKGRSERKIVFTAAGCERSFPKINTPKGKKDFANRNYSSEESSSESRKNVFKKLHRDYSEAIMEPVSPSEKNESQTDSSLQNQIETEEEPSKESDSSPEEHTPLPENPQPVSTLKIKPHCSCKQCNIWTKEENIFIEKFPKERKVGKLTGGNNQLLLKEDENTNGGVHICSLDYSSMKTMEKRILQKVLVHSESTINPIHLISQVAFDKNTQHNLYQLNYREAKRIQSYAWPAIFRNRHVFMINGPQTGKTIAYLPAMCTFILEKHDRYDSLLKVAGGPIVIILCGNTYKCEEVYDLTKVIIGNVRANVSLVTYPLAHINTSHTDMLITTPYILLDLLKSKSINFKRLCHLIIEDGDTVLHKYKDSMNAIFELAQSMLKHRVVTKALQLIVCAEHWNSHIKFLMMSLQQTPMVCIGNYLEAALYGKVEFSMKFINSSCKDLELRHLLKDSHRINKSVIICHEDEIEEIHEILTLKGINNIPILASTSQEDIMHYEAIWTESKGGTYSVLICSDFVFNTLLSITSATTLIHYSLPKSWSKFVKRLSCLLENCHSPLDSREATIISKNVVLCDESCKEQMYKFFSFINSTELRKQLPEKLQQFSETLRFTEEEQKLEKAIGLCANTKLFGKCIKKQCPKRHLVSANLDVSDYLPKSGKIKFKIVNVLDVTSYSIQLLQHVDNENKIHEYEEFADITEDLTATLHLSRKKIHNPVVGHHYAFYNFDEHEGIYYRCEILDIDNDCVHIKLIDKGDIIDTMISRIYRLPKEFNCDVKPRAIIDAFLANCVPPYNDENFSAKSFFNFKHLVEKRDYKSIIFSAEVHLQINHTLFLKEVCEEIVLSDKVIPGFQLSREVLLKKLVDSDLNQLKNLYQLCTDAGIILPSYEKPKASVPVKKEKVIMQWAHLEVDKINEVTFASAFSPEEVYVRLNKFSDLLYTLQKEIQQSIKKPNYPKLNDVKVGEIYLARDPVSLEYCRVLILKKEPENVLCFALDFADELIVPIKELKYIQPTFITKLPFQCIQCRLHGIKPFSDEWEDEATNLLYEYAHEPGTDIFRSLFIKVLKKESSSSANQTKYSVVLKDGFGEKNVLINQLLVDCGLVTTNIDEEISDFKIPAVEQDASDSNEELEDIAYICKKTDELDQHLESSDYPVNKENYRLEHNLEEMELFICGDPLKFYAQFMEREESPTLPRNYQLPAISAAPQVDYHTPDVYWSQTERHIKLSIRMIDVKDYTLTLNKRRILNFRTVKDQKTYCLKMMFYEVVETLQHTSSGPEIRITLNKVKYIDWPRLILSKQKTRNIHYDVMKIPLDDENRKFLQLPKELDEDEDEELDENDPMYIVDSDLDSDLDLDLKHDSD